MCDKFAELKINIKNVCYRKLDLRSGQLLEIYHVTQQISILTYHRIQLVHLVLRFTLIRF